MTKHNEQLTKFLSPCNLCLIFMYTRDVKLSFPNNSIKKFTLNFYPLWDYHYVTFLSSFQENDPYIIYLGLPPPPPPFQHTHTHTHFTHTCCFKWPEVMMLVVTNMFFYLFIFILCLCQFNDSLNETFPLKLGTLYNCMNVLLLET